MSIENEFADFGWFCSCGEFIIMGRVLCKRCGKRNFDDSKKIIQKKKKAKSHPKPKLFLEDDDKDKCVICLEKDSIICIKLCGHLGLCEECSKKIKECPICRKKFSEKDLLRIYRV
jgi:hypothetical protein